ncbi:hypothetical protein TcWFU_010279 [Taenia crassiceps]|uniref:Uncharacterized protein n=1 Tax=Taenia crassiceps TaxID=6207 RepID=A0ABR4QC94_9CEST
MEVQLEQTSTQLKASNAEFLHVISPQSRRIPIIQTTKPPNERTNEEAQSGTIRSSTCLALALVGCGAPSSPTAPSDWSIACALLAGRLERRFHIPEAIAVWIRFHRSNKERR